MVAPAQAPLPCLSAGAASHLGSNHEQKLDIHRATAAGWITWPALERRRVESGLDREYARPNGSLLVSGIGELKRSEIGASPLLFQEILTKGEQNVDKKLRRAGSEA